MPDRPKPHPAPKAFDVFKPGKTRPSPTSRPVIVGDKPQVQDHTLVEKHGAPVSNAHPATVPKRPKPVLKSLQPRQSALAPSASQTHHTVHHKPLFSHTPGVEATAEDAPKKVSRTGSTIAPPSASASHKLIPVSESAESKKQEEPEEPNLAAVPITPVEQPSSLTNTKTEGKAELLAAMPVEIRRSIASAEGKSEAEWDMPVGVPTTPAPSTPPAAVPADVPKASVNTAAPDGAPDTPVPPAPAQPAPAPVQDQPNKPEADEKPEAGKETASSLPIFKTKKHRSSDAVVFIIMLVLFLLLGALVILLFLSGSVTI